jgi:hypothetical protein
VLLSSITITLSPSTEDTAASGTVSAMTGSPEKEHCHAVCHA